jgi:hypothetical protein
VAHYIPDPALDPYEAENSFYLRSYPSRMAKLLAHYELYRRITHLPGAVVEMGVYKGASLMRFASFRDMLENAHSRPLIGFDAFGAFPRGEVGGSDDMAFIDRFEAAGGDGIAKADLEALIERKGSTISGWSKAISSRRCRRCWRRSRHSGSRCCTWTWTSMSRPPSCWSGCCRTWCAAGWWCSTITGWWKAPRGRRTRSAPNWA